MVFEYRQLGQSEGYYDAGYRRQPKAYRTKARLLALSLRENGLAWTALLGAYYTSSIIAERAFTRLQKVKLERGLPGTSSLHMNREIWENWDWTTGGEEWTASCAWKESMVRNVLRRWIPENSNIV